MAERPRVRIESNGPHDLHVYDTDGREILKRAVRRIEWVMEPPDFVPMAKITVILPSADLKAEVRAVLVEDVDEMRRQLQAAEDAALLMTGGLG